VLFIICVYLTFGHGRGGYPTSPPVPTPGARRGATRALPRYAGAMSVFKSLAAKVQQKKDEIEQQAKRKAAEKAAELAVERGKEWPSPPWRRPAGAWGARAPCSRTRCRRRSAPRSLSHRWAEARAGRRRRRSGVGRAGNRSGARAAKATAAAPR
jgi:hypothetical protein